MPVAAPALDRPAPGLEDLDPIARAVGLGKEDIRIDLMPRAVSAGIFHLMVGARAASAVSAALASLDHAPAGGGLAGWWKRMTRQ